VREVLFYPVARSTVARTHSRWTPAS
jgi:hypothetical protein